MVALFCGVLNLGTSAPLGPVVATMAGSLATGLQANRDIVVRDGCALAQIETAHSEPKAARIHRLGDALICGNFDFAYWRGEHSDDRPAGPAEIASRLLADPEEALECLDGEYAFALYDAKSGSLRLIRDRAGTRPIFFCHRPGAWLAFSSLPAPLRHVGFCDGERNVEIIVRLAVSNPNHDERTHLAGVHRVLPAHVLHAGAVGLFQKRYWRLSHRSRLPPRSDYDSVTKTLKGLVDTAVRRRLPADGRAFSHLSGGLDSTSVAVLAARALRQQGRRLTGYSLVPVPIDGVPQFIDERPAVAATVAENPNIDLVEIAGPSIERLPSMVTSMDFPHWINPELEYEKILAHAAQNGACSVLSGFGGDQVVSYATRGALVELFLKFRWWSLARLIKARGDRRSMLRSLAGQLFEIVMPTALASSVRRALGKRPTDTERILGFVAPAYRSQAADGLLRLRPDTHWMRARQFDHGHLTKICEELAWRGARHGLSYAFPLLDRDLLEYAIQIPAEFLLRSDLPRKVFRDSMRGVLPEPVRMRRDKLLIDPGTMYRFAGQKAALVDVVDSLRGTIADEVFDLAEIRRHAVDLPDADDVLAEINRLGSKGVQYSPGFGMVFFWPLNLARFAAMCSCAEEYRWQSASP